MIMLLHLSRLIDRNTVIRGQSMCQRDSLILRTARIDVGNFFSIDVVS